MFTKSKLEQTIANILAELDKEHADLQALYRKFHGEEDAVARHIYKLLTALCKRIREEMI